MPRISSFYGILIAMYYADHAPPHFHARYGEHEAQVLIASGTLLEGSLPRRAQALVTEWCSLHQEELVENWQRAQRHEPLASIEPLP